MINVGDGKWVRIYNICLFPFPFHYDETQKVKVQMMCPPHDSCFFTFYDKHSLFILKFYFGPTGVGYFFIRK